MMFKLRLLSLAVLSMLTFAPAAFAEIEFDSYLHCGVYSGTQPDISLVRYAPDPNSEFFRKAMWSTTYAEKKVIPQSSSLIRSETSCAAESISVAGQNITLAGNACAIVISEEADHSISVKFKNQPKLTNCTFDVPVTQLISDFKADKPAN